MDKKSKALIAIFVIAICISVFLTYERAFVNRDFIITESEPEESEENQ